MTPRNQRWILKGSGPSLFIEHYGKPIEQYSSIITATETLKPKTVDSYRKLLPFYFLYLDQDPDAVIAQRKTDLMSIDDAERYEKRTIAYAKTLEARGLSGNAIASQVSRIQGFYANNGKRLALDLHKLKISKARKIRKYSPSNDDVRVLFNAADSARDKLLVALMYQNGPAPMDVSLLKCGDYPVTPWVYFEKNRSKTGEIWRGVSTPDVCNCLKAYLAIRGSYDVGDVLFVGREGPFTSDGLSQVMRELIDRTVLRDVEGFKPTSLRDGFEDALVDAEIYPKLKEALMAHNSGIEAEYGGYNKMVAKLTEAMKRAYPFVCLNDNLSNPAELAGLSAEDVAEIKGLLSHKGEITRLLELAGAGELVNINDPELPKRLRDKGVIK